jgi:hypothetical protein
MLEKSWPEISKGLGKELEVFSASDVPDSVKASKVGTYPKKTVFRPRSAFDMVFIS